MYKINVINEIPTTSLIVLSCQSSNGSTNLVSKKIPISIKIIRRLKNNSYILLIPTYIDLII